MSPVCTTPTPAGTARLSKAGLSSERTASLVNAAKRESERFTTLDHTAIVAALQNPQLQADADQASAACMRLRVLCREARVAHAVSNLGACDIMAYTMTQHQGEPAVVLQALAVVVNLCAEHDDMEAATALWPVEVRRQAAFRCGLLGAVVEAMQRHTDQRAIQEMGFMAVNAIAYGDDSAASERKSAAVGCGALGCIIAAIDALEATVQDAWHLNSIEVGKGTLVALCDGSREHRRKAMGLGAQKQWFERFGSPPSSALVQSSPQDVRTDTARRNEAKFAAESEEPSPSAREHPGRETRASQRSAAAASVGGSSPREKVVAMRAAMQRTERRLEQQAAKLAAAEEELSAADAVETQQGTAAEAMRLDA